MNNRTALYTLMSVWFFWGFIAASNGILIPMFKEQFNLQQWQSQLVDFAFYAAYFVGSILYFLVSAAQQGEEHHGTNGLFLSCKKRGDDDQYAECIGIERRNIRSAQGVDK